MVNFHTATPADYRHGFLIGSLVIMIVTVVIITIKILDIVSVFISPLKVLVDHMTCGILYYGACNKRKYKIFRKLDHAINNS